MKVNLSVVLDVIEMADDNYDGTLPRIANMYSGKENEWDYRKFNLEYCNVFFKDNVCRIRCAYEECE